MFKSIKPNEMQNKRLIVGMLMLISFSVFGQNFISENKQWNVKHAAMPYSVRTEIFKFKGDTVVNELVYNMIYASYDSTNSWYYHGMLREDKNKVYYIRPNGSEKLLYDFNLEVGDQTFISNYFCDEVPISVTDIDTIQINGQTRKRWHINSEYLQPEYWIEGIGSLNGPIYSYYEACIVCPSWELLCYYEDESPVYILPNQTTCFIWLGLDEQKGKAALNIKPNPVKKGDDFTIETTAAPVKISVYNSVGILVEHIKAGEGNTIQLSTNHLKPGIYFVTIIDKANQRSTQKLLVE